jgi:hypothetical protein
MLMTAMPLLIRVHPRHPRSNNRSSTGRRLANPEATCQATLLGKKTRFQATHEAKWQAKLAMRKPPSQATQQAKQPWTN